MTAQLRTPPDEHSPVVAAARAISAAALADLEAAPPSRVRTLLVALVRHLHTFAVHTRLTEDELAAGLAFLVRAGQESTPQRSELVILSDVLGLSSVVDAVGHVGLGGTASALLGPFHVPGAPERADGDWAADPSGGPPMVVRGTVCSTDGVPLPGAEVDVWHCGANGLYDVQDPDAPEWNGRGRYRTGPGGRFTLRTVRPVPYPVPTDGQAGVLLRAAGRTPMRAAHVHLRVTAAGHAPLTTQFYDVGDPQRRHDATYAVQDALVRPWTRVDDAGRAAELGVTAPFTLLELDVRLVPSES